LKRKSGPISRKLSPTSFSVDPCHAVAADLAAASWRRPQQLGWFVSVPLCSTGHSLTTGVTEVDGSRRDKMAANRTGNGIRNRQIVGAASPTGSCNRLLDVATGNNGFRLNSHESGRYSKGTNCYQRNISLCTLHNNITCSLKIL
jgi:hypothetical protein